MYLVQKIKKLDSKKLQNIITFKPWINNCIVPGKAHWIVWWFINWMNNLFNELTDKLSDNNV